MKKSNLILYALAALALLILLAQPFYTWFAADDYCYLQKVKSQGIFKGMLDEYMRWDGRSISLTFPICRAGLYFEKYWLGPMIGTILLLTLAYVMLQIANIEFKNKVQKVVTVVALAVLIWLAEFNITAQTLYWTTGVGYNMDVLMVATAYLLFKRWKNNWQYFVMGIPVYFYAGTASPNSVLALLFVLFADFMKEVVFTKKMELKSISIRYGYAGFWILLAFAVVLLAPGNANRIGGLDKQNFTHIWTIYFNVKSLIFKLWEYNTPVIWMLILVGMVCAVKSLAWQKTEIVYTGFFKTWIARMYAYRWLLAACIAYFFFLPFPSLAAPRTNIQFVTYAFLFATIYIGEFFGSHIFQETKEYKGIIVAILALFVLFGMQQIFDARYVKNQLAMRELKLIKMQGSDAVLTAEDVVRPPGTRRFEDVSSDTSYWLNQCVAQRYRLKTIRLDDQLNKKDYYKNTPKSKQMGE